MSNTSRSDGAGHDAFRIFDRGAIPAICLGLGTVFMRASLGAGASIPLYLAVVGSVVALLGWSSFIWTGDAILSVRPVLLAAAMGMTWTLAIACMARVNDALDSLVTRFVASFQQFIFKWRDPARRTPGAGHASGCLQASLRYVPQALDDRLQRGRVSPLRSRANRRQSLA
jgi:hypothetical protein